MAKANLTPQQRAQIASRFEVWGSIIEVRRWFRSTFGIHKQVSPNTIKTCHYKMLNVGNVLRKPYKSRSLTARTQDNIDAVKKTCDENHSISVRQISKTSGISYGSVYRILKKDLNFKPWKAIAVQQIFPEDEDRRLEFAETFLNLQFEMPHLFENIIYGQITVGHICRRILLNGARVCQYGYAI